MLTYIQLILSFIKNFYIKTQENQNQKTPSLVKGTPISEPVPMGGRNGGVASASNTNYSEAKIDIIQEACKYKYKVKTIIK